MNAERDINIYYLRKVFSVIVLSTHILREIDLRVFTLKTLFKTGYSITVIY